MFMYDFAATNTYREKLGHDFIITKSCNSKSKLNYIMPLNILR